MAAIRFQIYILAFCAGLVIQSSCCNGHSGLQKKRAALFVFGDSLYDAGNNNYMNTTTDFQANWFPYGETFFRYPTGRFSDGRTIPDFIAEYAKLPFIPVYLQPGLNDYTYGVNFASGGAGALVETYQGSVMDLKTQVSQFKKVEKQLRQKLGDAEAYTLVSEAVYIINIGNNDYVSPLATNTSHEEYVGWVIGNLTSWIEDIYQKGGRKFALSSLAPFASMPLMRTTQPAGSTTGPSRKEVAALVKLHNRVLAKVLLKLKKELQGFKYSKLNLYTYLKERINHPLKYGFKEGKMACCGSGAYRGIYSCGGKRSVTEYLLCDNATEFVFFDCAHPTERVNKQLSKLWWSNNLKELFEV
ncbi:GDSL esterase/lipase 1-like [Prunus avium]|uniref:GDSL esterase/lipase 1-like n=1 Tax=Prunus avium TaxID=42229 RepID=A0A6P5T177_PRUAV|nr:GDSL esterase/lipase 1-like [Prunus avium]